MTAKSILKARVRLYTVNAAAFTATDLTEEQADKLWTSLDKQFPGQVSMWLSYVGEVN